MTVLTIEVSEKLLAKLRRIERPVQDVVVEALEQLVNNQIETKEQKQSEPSREEIIQKLVSAGLVRQPGSWDTPGAKVWREMPMAEKQQLMKEMQATYFPDSFASQLVSENRR